MHLARSHISEGRIRSYRFGFNGQEKDNEVYGEGNAYSFEYRIHDPRIGRFLSVDPLYKKYPFYTPYQFAANQPILASDLEGLENPLDKAFAALTGKNLSESEIRQSDMPYFIKGYLLTYKAVNLSFEGRVKAGLGVGLEFNVADFLQVSGLKDWGSYNAGVNSNTGLITDKTTGYKWDAGFVGQSNVTTELYKFDGRTESPEFKGITTIKEEKGNIMFLVGTETTTYNENGNVVNSPNINDWASMSSLETGFSSAAQLGVGFSVDATAKLDLGKVRDAWTNQGGGTRTANTSVAVKSSASSSLPNNKPLSGEVKKQAINNLVSKLKN